jgi:hypothetical protein
MQPGDRVRLAEGVYRNLLDRPDWSTGFVDYMLDEFGAEDRPADIWSRRLLARIRSLSDENLLALHTHLHPDADNPPAPLHQIEAPGPWRPEWFRLFLSHTTAHKALAQGVKSWMERVRIDAFVAHSTIEPTREWEDDIRSALKTCDALVAVLTDDFPKSRWCDQEVGVAVGLAKLIVPVRRDLDPYGFIGRYQGLTLASNAAGAIEQSRLSDALFGLLARNENTKERMTEPVLARFVHSWSWDNTRAAWGFVTELPKQAWTTEWIQRAREAIKLNTEIRLCVLRDGTPVPKALESHLRSMGVWPDDEQPVTPVSDDEIPF